jgi:hypothetical protein
MSMWLDVVVMNEAAFEAVKKDEELLGDVYQQEASVLKKLGIAKSDIGGCDYLSMNAAVEAMAELEGGDDDEEPDFQAEGSLSYEGTYGPAMFWSPKTFARALADASGWQMAIEMDDEIKAMTKRAVKEGLWVVAVIN